MATDSRPPSNPMLSTPPEAWEPLLRAARKARQPLERFLQIEASSGILLIVAAAVALCCANSGLADHYAAFWQTPVGLRFGGLAFERDLAFWVNDGLMAIFFFVVGLEIRREIHAGELSELRRASLPAAAALGGMIVPACLYLAIAGAPATRSGWGVPMATDIAFAVGVLALLGKRVPAALRVLLLAVAVIDDLGAIVVIAVFYSSGLSLSGALVAVGGLAGIIVLQRLGVRTKVAYIPPALVAWGGVYAAGIHPTIAGVVIGLMTPVRAWFGPDGFIAGVRHELDHLEVAGERGAVSTHQFAETLNHVQVARREALSPAESLIEMLHPWVAFGIMPIFALANAGVSLGGGALDAAAWTVFAGSAVGLLAGKPLGVVFASWLAVRVGIARLPAGLTVRHLVVLGTVAGIGFTMAIFIAQLAFRDPTFLTAAKLGILSASGLAALAALALGRALLGPQSAAGVAQTADEAERSTEA